MNRAAIKPTHFSCGDVSWKLLDWTRYDLKVHAATLSQVKSFTIVISTGAKRTTNPETDNVERGSKLLECSQLLGSGRLHGLIAAAESLNTFILNSITAIQSSLLTYIRVALLFSGVAKAIHNSTDLHRDDGGRSRVLFAQTQSTLRVLRLGWIRLTHGHWTTLVPRIHSSLQLDDLFWDGGLMERDFWPRFHLVRIP
jgi:hypothetical protein